MLLVSKMLPSSVLCCYTGIAQAGQLKKEGHLFFMVLGAGSPIAGYCLMTRVLVLCHSTAKSRRVPKKEQERARLTSALVIVHPGPGQGLSGRALIDLITSYRSLLSPAALSTKCPTHEP